MSFESADDRPLHCLGLLRVILSFTRKLRRRNNVFDRAGAESDAPSRVGPYANPEPYSNTKPHTHTNTKSYADAKPHAGATDSFGYAFVVAKLLHWCGNVQCLSLDNTLFRVRENR